MKKHFIILVDVSFSMTNHIHKFVYALNKFLYTLKQDNFNQNYITVGQFSHIVKYICEYKDVKNIEHFDICQFNVFGTTALYDAIFHTIKATKDIEAYTSMYIISDGDDNASFYTNKNDIDKIMLEMIEDKRWNIVHCNIDMNMFNVPTVKYDMDELANIFDKIII